LLAMSIPNLEVLQFEADIHQYSQHVIQNGSDRFESQHRCKDGRIIDVQVNVNLLKDNQKIFVFIHDITERKQTEKSLVERENRIGSIYRSAPVGIGLVNNRFLTNVNDRLCEMTGYLEDELINQSSEILYPSKEDYEYVGKEKYKQIKKYGTGTIETHFKRKDGKIIDVLLSSTPIDLEDLSKGVTFSALDISERKQAEEKLKASDRIFFHSLDMLCIAGFDGYFKILNPAWEKTLGWSNDELLQNSWLEFVHPDDRNATENVKSVIVDGKEIYQFENRYICKDGGVKWLSWNSFPYPEDGVMYGVARDITERKKAEEKIEESEEKFRQLAENTNEVFWLRTDNKILYINPAFEKVFGLPCKAIYDNPQVFTDMIHPDDKQSFSASVQSNEFKETGVFNSDYRIVRRDNEIRWINAKTYPVNNEKGGINRRVGLATDITERKIFEKELIKAKEKAEESDRLKSAFLANMSHEIRTPMNGILGFADLLKKPELTGEKQQEYVRIIEKSGARMLNIINDIIDISKVEAGLMKMDIKETNINEQIEYIYTFFKPEVEGKGMQLSFSNSLPSREVTLKTDREKVYAILANLVKNAIKYSEKGSIEFGYVKKAGFLEFYVKDTGIGIPKDRQEAIFERFIQVDIADEMARQGAGLGLSISKAYVEMLGGKIWVESDEGKGSTFYFTLPYQTEPKEKIVPENEDGSEKSGCKANSEVLGLKILVAEDDETSQMLFSALVKEHSKALFEARTGIEAVDICRNNPDIDLVLMDIQMPGINGYEATRQIRQFNKDVIIIAQTAFGLSGDKDKAIEAGCNDYISKPIIKNELMYLIKQYFIK